MVSRNVQCQHVILVTGLKQSVQCERTASTTSCCLDNLVHSVYLKIKIITFSHHFSWRNSTLHDLRLHLILTPFGVQHDSLSDQTWPQHVYVCACVSVRLCVCCQHFVVTMVSLRCNLSPQRNQSMPSHIGLPLATNDASVSQPMEREDQVSH